MNFIKQIFEGKADASMHHKFVRYGRGEYERLYFEVSNEKSSLKVKSSFDFANDFVGLIAENLKNEAEVNGKIIASRDFTAELKSIGINAVCTKRGQLYSADINAKLNPEQLKNLYSAFKTNVLLLSIAAEGFKLKTKTAIPKPGGEIKNDFCNATLPKSLLSEFVWEKEDFAKASIRHIIKIDEIIIPPELKNDPAKARIESIRKGKLIRIAVIDNKEFKSEANFAV